MKKTGGCDPWEPGRYGERKEDKDCREIQAAHRVPPGNRQQTWLTCPAPLPGTARAPETHLQVKGDADHKVPENRQESANQVFLEGSQNRHDWHLSPQVPGHMWYSAVCPKTKPEQGPHSSPFRPPRRQSPSSTQLLRDPQGTVLSWKRPENTILGYPHLGHPNGPKLGPLASERHWPATILNRKVTNV